MNTIIKFFVIVPLFLIVLSGIPLFAQVKNENVTIEVDWRKIRAGQEPWNELYDKEKISESTAVSLNIINFNFLRYNLEHEIMEEVIESYQVLENLWGQVFSGLFGEKGGFRTTIERGAQDIFLENLMIWQNELIESENALQGYLNSFPKSIDISEENKACVKKKIVEFKKLVENLHCLNMETKNKIYTSQNTSLSSIGPFKLTKGDEVVAEAKKNIKMKTDTVHSAVDAYYASILYNNQLKDHEKIMMKFAAFFSKAELILAGKKISLEKKEPGTLVTAKLTPTGIGAEDNKSDSAPTPVIRRYFVQSDMPVVFHVGYSLSSLNNAEFDTIKTLTGEEVYAQITDEDVNQNLSAFLSYELWASNDLSRSLALTIGTEMASPGEKIYLGGSIKLERRWFITLALATGEITEGIDENTGDSEIKLFKTIKNTRKWGVVAAISIRLF